jgi:hypothetical protein
MAKKNKLSTQPPGRFVEGRQPSTPKTPTNALYKNADIKEQHTTLLCVEPVLRAVLDLE